MATISSYSFDHVAASSAALETQTDDQGNPWRRHPGAAASHAEQSSIQGVTHGTANLLCLSYVETDPGTADYAAECALTRRTDRNAATNVFGVAIRIDAAALTYYSFVFNDDTTDKFRLRKSVAGTVTDIATAVSTATAGVDTSVGQPPFTLRIEGEGTTIRGLVNGAVVLTATDSTITAAGNAGIVSLNNQDGLATAHTTFDDFLAETIAAPVVADRIAFTLNGQPNATYAVGDTVTLGGAAQDVNGATQTDLAAGTVAVRARSAPTGWDLTTVLDTDTWAAGLVAPSFQIPMAGVWTFGLDDDSNALADSPDSSSTTVSLPTGGGTTIRRREGRFMAQALTLSDSLLARLRFRLVDSSGAGVGGITGNAKLSKNDAAPVDSTNTIVAGPETGDYYVVAVSGDCGGLAAKDTVRVTLFGTGVAEVEGGAGLIFADDYTVAPQLIAVDANDKVIPAPVETQAIVEGSTITTTAALDTTQATQLATAASGATAAKTAAEGLRTDIPTASAQRLATVARTTDLPAAAPSAAAVASQVRTELATELGRLDAAVSTAGGLTSAESALLAKLAKEVAQGGTRGIRSGDTVTINIADADGAPVGTRTITYRSATSTEIASIGPVV